MRRINFEECDHLIRLRCVIIKAEAIGQGMVDMCKSKLPAHVKNRRNREFESSKRATIFKYLNIRYA